MSTFHDSFNVQGASVIAVPFADSHMPPIEIPINGSSEVVLPVPAPGYATGVAVISINGASSILVPDYPDLE